MGVVKLSKSEITDYQKYSSMLAGNPAYSPPAFDLLETTVLSTTTASVTFNNLGSYSNYKHLQLRYVGKSTSSSQDVDLFIRINGVSTASSHRYHRLVGSGQLGSYSVYSDQGSENLFRLSRNLNGSGTSSQPNQFGAGVIDILDFLSTSKLKTIRSFYGMQAFYNSMNDVGTIALLSGALQSTNAMSSIELFVNDNFVAGSRFSLYGIK